MIDSVDREAPTLRAVLRESSALRQRFNGSAGRPRLLAFLSPTCEVCLDGAAIVMRGLCQPEGDRFDVHFVWLPVLPRDERAVATEMAGRYRHERVTHYWDRAQELSDLAHAVLDLSRRDRSLAWDVYLLYRAGLRWESELPSPEAWLHQLRLEDQPSLDAGTLRDAMRFVSVGW